jgi:hypothetical protein
MLYCRGRLCQAACVILFGFLAGEPVAATEYNWTEPYQAALFELNPEKISDQIIKAEDVIQKRRMELLQASKVGDELNAIEQALKALSQLMEVTQRRP